MRAVQVSLISVALLVTATPAFAEMKVVSQGKAIQIQTDEFIVRSDSILRDFIIEVSRVDGLLPNQKTAVIYATDGGFGVVGPMSRALMADGKIPKTLVVSIGYPNEKGRHAGPRQLDLAHGHLELQGRSIDGEGAAFETFILNEVRPFIEARYPVDPKRSVLFGHSMGGLFVANVLLRKPDAFAGYLIGGLPVAGDPSLIEKAKAVAPRGNGARVFIGYCPDDIARMRSNEFTAPLSGPGSTFKVMEQNFTDEKHNSEILMLIAKGFRFLLPTDGSDRTAIALKSEIIDRYVGTYRIDASQTISITRKGARVFAALRRGEQTNEVEVFAESEIVFFARDAYSQVTFTIGADGKPASLIARINEVDVPATRVQ